MSAISRFWICWGWGFIIFDERNLFLSHRTILIQQIPPEVTIQGCQSSKFKAQSSKFKSQSSDFVPGALPSVVHKVKWRLTVWGGSIQVANLNKVCAMAADDTRTDSEDSEAALDVYSHGCVLAPSEVRADAHEAEFVSLSADAIDGAHRAPGAPTLGSGPACACVFRMGCTCSRDRPWGPRAR